MEGERQVVLKQAAAVALTAGALASIAGLSHGSSHRTVVPLAASTDLATALVASQEPGLRTVHAVSPGSETVKLLQAEQIQAQYNFRQALQVAQDGFAAKQEALRVEQARLAAEAEARRPKCVKPTEGQFTSGFGARWGTSHNGIDIANRIGTPILSAMDGVVVEAGAASGFGLWVRVQHADGTITVYGHVDRIIAQEGTKVRAGQQIATMGNRGQSTGPHLHFEVWLAGSQKINPVAWLSERGVSI